MAVKYLDSTGLGYVWSKFKAWCNATFAAITHNQASNTINAMTGYSKPNSGSAIATSDSLNSAIGKLEAKVDFIGDNNCVHKTGDEVIDGIKVFKQLITTQDDTFTRGTVPNEGHFPFFYGMKDSAYNMLGGIYYTYGTDKSTFTHLMCYRGITNENVWNYIGIGYNALGDVYTRAPTPPTADNSTQIATTAFVKAQNYAVKHYAVVGQYSTPTKNWFKVASVACIHPNSDYEIVFFVENTYFYHGHGILRVHVRTEADRVLNLSQCTIEWLVRANLNIDQYVLVLPSGSDQTVELWTRINAAYVGRRFVVLSGGYRDTFNTVWTLYNTGFTYGQAESITTEGTQKVSVDVGTVYRAENVTGVIGITNGGTGATSLAGARQSLFGEVMTADNYASFAIIGANWEHCGWMSTDNVKSVLGLQNYLPLTGGIINGYIRINANPDWSGALDCNGHIAMLMLAAKGTNPSSWTNRDLAFMDNTGVAGDAHNIARLRTYVDQYGNVGVQLTAMQFIENNTNGATIGIFINKDGTNWASCPTPSSSANNTNIATTAWVRTYHSSSSDKRVKQDFANISEELLDAWDNVSWQQYRLINEVKESGDNAPTRFGIVVQDVQKLLKDNNVDPDQYEFMYHLKYQGIDGDEPTEDNPEITKADKWYLNYNEALSIEAAYQRRKNKILERRILELETQVENMLQVLESLKGA